MELLQQDAVGPSVANDMVHCQQHCIFAVPQLNYGASKKRRLFEIKRTTSFNLGEPDQCILAFAFVDAREIYESRSEWKRRVYKRLQSIFLKYKSCTKDL